MKEASGEASMTFITIAAIALIAGFFAFLWPRIKEAIENKWGNMQTSTQGIVLPMDLR